MGQPGDYSDAACRQRPTNFFPERGTAQIAARDAKTICNGDDESSPCPKLAQCLEDALANKERFGIWGGKSERERAKIAKERRVATKKRELEVVAARERRSKAAKLAWERRRAAQESEQAVKATSRSKPKETRATKNGSRRQAA